MIRYTIFLFLRFYYKIFFSDVIIESNVKLYKTNIGKFIRLKKNSELKRSFIDNYSYIGQNSILNNSKIGKFTSIGNNVILINGQHPTNFVSTHPIFYSLRKQIGITFVTKQKFDEFKLVDNYSLIIGNDVWIGESVKIMEGVKIGDGAIIASGSIVTKDIEPYSINGGIPSKIIKYRFEEKYINWLLEFKWWDKDLNWIKENADYFDNIESFYERYNK